MGYKDARRLAGAIMGKDVRVVIADDTQKHSEPEQPPAVLIVRGTGHEYDGGDRPPYGEWWYCPKCGRDGEISRYYGDESEPERCDNFCPNCGVRIEWVDPREQKDVQPEYHRCPGCGVEILASLSHCPWCVETDVEPQDTQEWSHCIHCLCDMPMNAKYCPECGLPQDLEEYEAQQTWEDAYHQETGFAYKLMDENEAMILRIAELEAQLKALRDVGDALYNAAYYHYREIAMGIKKKKREGLRRLIKATSDYYDWSCNSDES
jgi:hypothetical protein